MSTTELRDTFQTRVQKNVHREKIFSKLRRVDGIRRKEEGGIMGNFRTQITIRHRHVTYPWGNFRDVAPS